MKTILCICALFILRSIELHAADNYEAGDTLYVWAKSGLILRDGPGVKSARIDALGFGTPVVVVGKSNERFNVKLFTPASKDYLIGRVEPVIFYGHWVEVRTSSGQVGYVIDQYLLPMAPHSHSGALYTLNIAQMSADTLVYEPTTEDGIYFSTVTQYAYHMQVSFTIYGKGNYSLYHFPGLTLEESVILFLASAETEFPIHVYRNWANHISILLEQCDVEFKLEGNMVKASMGCSC